MKWPFHWLNKLLNICIAIVVLFHMVLLVYGAIGLVTYSKIHPNFSALSFYRLWSEGQENIAVSKNYVKYEDIPRPLISLVVALEDQSFFSHMGVDPNAILMAVKRNLIRGTYAMGGSTISQQLVKNLLLWPQKSLARKYMELWLTLEMEFFLPKKKILELYLNYIEWGNGIYGVADAAKYRMNKKLSKLSIEDMKKLVVILPNPRRYEFSDIKDNYRLQQRMQALSYSYVLKLAHR